jgi:hypothetical protein
MLPEKARIVNAERLKTLFLFVPAVVTGVEILLQQVHQLLKLTQHHIHTWGIFPLWVLPLQGRFAAAKSGKSGVVTAVRATEGGGQSVDNDLASSGG